MWGTFKKPYLLFTFNGSPSPTVRDRVNRMAPLSSFGLIFSEPRIIVAPVTYQGLYMKDTGNDIREALNAKLNGARKEKALQD